MGHGRALRRPTLDLAAGRVASPPTRREALRAGPRGYERGIVVASRARSPEAIDDVLRIGLSQVEPPRGQRTAPQPIGEDEKLPIGTERLLVGFQRRRQPIPQNAAEGNEAGVLRSAPQAGLDVAKRFSSPCSDSKCSATMSSGPKPPRMQASLSNEAAYSDSSSSRRM